MPPLSHFGSTPRPFSVVVQPRQRVANHSYLGLRNGPRPFMLNVRPHCSAVRAPTARNYPLGALMTVVLTAGLILLFIAALGAVISGAMVLSETLTRRYAVENLISGAEHLLRTSA
jgi:hypothetical protein